MRISPKNGKSCQDCYSISVITISEIYVQAGDFPHPQENSSQCLRASGHNAYFYKETSAETKRTVMEIDFLLRKENKIIPVEIKSGTNKNIISLRKFKEKFRNRIGSSIVLHHGEIKREDDITYLPYYMSSVL